VQPSLRGYARAVLVATAGSDRLATVAAELDQVRVLVESSAELSATLTDIVVDLRARRAVLGDLLGERIDPATMRLVLRAVTTEAPDELLIALENLAHQAQSAVHRGDVGVAEPVLGRSSTRALLAGFAAAIFEDLAEVAQIEEVEDELFRFARVVESNPELVATLSDPGRTPRDRRKLVGAILEGRATTATVLLAQEAVATRARDVVAQLDWLVEQAAAARGWRLARVRTGRDIDDEGRDALEGALRTLTGRPVELQVTVDPSLIGGVVVQIGDLLVDGSARHRLEEIEEHLLGTEGTTRGAQ
jgi:F-type H+-transporting ATPase subunit delta